jgi:two-component system, sensor histidine kinase
MMKRRDMSIGQRLFTGSGVIAILILILSAVMVLSVSRVKELQREQSEVFAPRAAAAAALEISIYQQAVAFRNYVITRAPSELAEFRRTEQQVEVQMRSITSFPNGEEDAALFSEMLPLVNEHRAKFDSFLALVSAGAESAALRDSEREVAAIRNQLLDRVRRYETLKASQNQAASRGISAAIGTLRNTVMVVTLLMIVALVVKSVSVGRAVRDPAAKLMAAAESLRAGQFGPALELEREQSPDGAFRDELREAGHLFGRMAVALKRREERLAAHARLSGVLSSSLHPSDVASAGLREVSGYSAAEVGVIYLNEGNSLRPVATAAMDDGAAVLALGEGIPGQAARERRTIVVRDLPPDTSLRLRLGIDQLPPKSVVASPLLIEERLVGVLVLGSIREIQDEAILFVEQSAAQLAISLDNALAHARIEALATQLQCANESLQVQNEELQAQSEELQAQNEELQAQSEELQTQADELQTQAEELRLQQENLARTNEALEQAEEQKNRFLAVLGHELRNPLAAITGAVSLLGDGNGNDERMHDVVRRQTSHLATLLDDLLDISRITSGKIVLVRKPVELGAVAERCASLLRAKAAGCPVVVETREPVWLDGDETRIEQIVTNLLTNAVKFTPADGTITLHVREEAGDAVLRVVDTGIGIAPDLLPRVFDFFVQGPMLKANQGLGIGLTLVRTLTELHDGTVEAWSEGEGRGTTFTVRFPAIDRPVIVAEQPVANSRLPIKRSVVLVEDNDDVRQIMQHWLRNAGHEVSAAHDGPTGVEAVTAAKPDIALIDLDLPGFDGCEVARRLRQNRAMNTVRLIAVSGYGRPEDRVRALASGFDDHLVKPLDFAKLATLLGAPLGRT